MSRTTWFRSTIVRVVWRLRAKVRRLRTIFAARSASPRMVSKARPEFRLHRLAREALGRRQDGRQRVVELVGDARDGGAERGEFLGLQELVVELARLVVASLALGDVADDGEERDAVRAWPRRDPSPRPRTASRRRAAAGAGARGRRRRASRVSSSVSRARGSVKRSGVEGAAVGVRLRLANARASASGTGWRRAVVARGWRQGADEQALLRAREEGVEPRGWRARGVHPEGCRGHARRVSDCHDVRGDYTL